LASSTALDLVNTVLRTTGDAKPVTTIAGSTGGIAERIIDFLNLVIGDVEKRNNWPALRSNSQGTANGVDDIFEFTGAEDLRVGGAVSVWISGSGELLQELTPEQFDAALSSGQSGTPIYFQRGVAASGKLQVQIYPKPTAGSIVNSSGYKKATKFTTADDTATTEFDDELLVYGALMHLDLYDGLDRGYAALFKQQLDVTALEVMSSRQIAVAVDNYQ